MIFCIRRLSYNGITQASQACDEGSTPFSRFYSFFTKGIRTYISLSVHSWSAVAPVLIHKISCKSNEYPPLKDQGNVRMISLKKLLKIDIQSFSKPSSHIQTNHPTVILHS